jgi:hypothetical protein
MGATEIVVIVLVVGARLLLPLLIPYVPVVGLLSCLILDAADQTIFQQFPAIDLDGYQSYDKALDIYYLTVAYLSTFRNWTNEPAFRVSQFLFYYRLIGNLAFELTQVRLLLFIFPNTFEYFFLFFELCRIRWDQTRMSMKMAIGSAAFIWIFIKLPQEWWIHIAELDFTDFVSDYPWTVIPMVIVGVAVLTFAWWWITRKAPAADHRFRILADPLPPELTGADLYRDSRARERIFDLALAQKAVLIAVIVVIFAQFLAPSGNRPFQIALSVIVFVALSTMVSQWLARRGRTWRRVAIELAAMMAINLGLAVILEILENILGLREDRVPFVALLFFIFLVTLLIILFDRYHLVYAGRQRLRRAGAESPQEPGAAAGGSTTAGAGSAA